MSWQHSTYWALILVLTWSEWLRGLEKSKRIRQPRAVQDLLFILLTKDWLWVSQHAWRGSLRAWPALSCTHLLCSNQTAFLSFAKMSGPHAVRPLYKCHSQLLEHPHLVHCPLPEPALLLRYLLRHPKSRYPHVYPQDSTSTFTLRWFTEGLLCSRPCYSTWGYSYGWNTCPILEEETDKKQISKIVAHRNIAI